MKRLGMMTLCAIAFMLIAAPIYMNQPAHAVFVNGKPVGNAVTVNGVLAISLDDFAKAVGGTTNLQQAGLTLNGNRLSTLPRHLQASNSADTFTLASPRDVATGQASGKRQHGAIAIIKEWGAASPLLTLNGKQFLSLSELARGFGGTFTAPARLANGAPINLNFAPNPNAAFAMEH